MEQVQGMTVYYGPLLDKVQQLLGITCLDICIYIYVNVSQYIYLPYFHISDIDLFFLKIFWYSFYIDVVFTVCIWSVFSCAGHTKFNPKQFKASDKL